jgi:DUF917 family protein
MGRAFPALAATAVTISLLTVSPIYQSDSQGPTRVAPAGKPHWHTLIVARSRMARHATSSLGQM